jgi:hypothetical protein
VPESLREQRRREQDEIEAELATITMGQRGIVADDDPRRCACAGVGRFHEYRLTPPDCLGGGREVRCQHCNRLWVPGRP